MDYYLLTDLAAQVGHGLAISGAETFRVEDTIRRILRAYGIECEVFAIPNSPAHRLSRRVPPKTKQKPKAPR